MTDTPRLIEHALPLKQASLDSAHEKNVRHGHISTLHIWPTRWPLVVALQDDCATPTPRLGRVQDPFGNAIARAKGSVLIGQAQIVEAGIQQDTLV